MKYLILFSLIGSCYAANLNSSSPHSNQSVASSPIVSNKQFIIFNSQIDVVSEDDPRIKSIVMLVNQRHGSINITCSDESIRFATSLANYFKRLNLKATLSIQSEFNNKLIVKVFVNQS